MTKEELMEREKLCEDDFLALVEDFDTVRRSGLANMNSEREVQAACEELSLYNLGDVLYSNRGALRVIISEYSEVRHGS